ncbi:PSD1 and planctomycete cytochrome C domain-containing protein [Blastopirellula sp. JC732]|uniref:PSD1 and planctomycete cytochrome C domain-containing protein n=1 Tax=Blastopirellula sediminis TaxID=2894196 RepID=A0A9X1MNL8_9BACT|nr:PSD1 and planctomycete cytochrome C domain-containing protein [Blastopirellula sediminis]MCC9607125.1 PSD1 and planctomycete cytochrome C domain-containing protein [Blastopirellula sediminis]MCC9629582.1 PSD1 and planctomycete cytochrome C domain-containing protein [Blastopirellula sediminis]
MNSLARIACVTFAVLIASPALAQKKLDYNRDVRPILSENCFYCHGPDSKHRQADLRLDDEASAKEYAIVPGDLDGSDFYQRIISTDADMQMPPHESGKKLKAEEVALLKRWIEEGAEFAPYWAYVQPQRHEAPNVDNVAWSHTEIDRLLLNKMQSVGLTPAPAADKVTLLRRVTFDLTGLPPTPQEVADFVADQSPEAFEKVVDRLLASQHYGERMAIYWLDLVRYADTVGYHGDQDHNISPYRDYVLDAFNDNLPFDQFTRDQLAGDLLPESSIDQKIATGYNRLLQTTHEGGLQQKEYLAIYAADRVRNVSLVWMGATVGCAQCHDHKYDPYTIKDFYALGAFFADVDEAKHFTQGSNALPTKRPPEIKVNTRRERAELARLEAELSALRQTQAAEHKETETTEVAVKADEKQQKEAAKEPPMSPAEKKLVDAIKQLNDAARLTMVTESIKPREMRVLPRGNWLDDSGEIVTPAIPEFMGQVAAGGERATRLDLANWFVDVENGAGGLTARVMVNRLWYLFYGVGLSKSLDDFGGQGEPPVHPELLDNLAIDFATDWDVKRIVKEMVMTAAYQQSSQTTAEVRSADPYNRYYSHQSRHRLPAEMVRDNALAISGLLNLQYGGPSIRPYQPEGYYRHLNFPQRKYHANDNERQWRRGVYIHWQRQFLHPMLKAFDAPSREECTAQRPQSNTPTAALVLLNDPTFVEAARAFADRILTAGPQEDAQRINFAYQLALSRDAQPLELEVLTKVLADNREIYQADPKAAASLLNVGIQPPDKKANAAELAAWTQVARVILNLDETITRN